MHHRRSGAGQNGDLGVINLHAMREQGLLGDHPGPLQPLDHAHRPPGLRIPLIGVVLGDVEVQPGAGLVGARDAGRERLVGQGERGVRPHEAAGQLSAAGANRLQEALVLGDAGAGRLGAVPVGHLVAEHRAQPE